MAISKDESPGGWMKEGVSDPLHSGLRAAAGSSLLAFKWLPYQSGAASMYEQVGQQHCQGQKAYHACQCLWGPHVLSPVPPEVFSAFQGFLSTRHLSPLMCGLEPHLPICILVLIGKN